MRYAVILPGLGYGTLSKAVLRLQPWNYLLQLAGALAREGHDVTVAFPDAGLGEGVAELAMRVGASAVVRGGLPRSLDAVLVPVAAGYLLRVREAVSKAGERVVGVLTTPLSPLPDLVPAAVKVWLSRSGVAAGAVVKENLLFRLRGKSVCSTLDALVVPSPDYADVVRGVLPCRLPITEYLPVPDEPPVSGVAGPRTVITYFGPVSEERGVFTLIKAFRRVAGEVNEEVRLRLLIREAGGVEAERLARVLRRAEGVDARYVELGRRELFTELTSSGIIALPYRLIPSTIPLAYLESLMLEGPLVISTDVPGVRHHVRQYLDNPPGPAYTVSGLATVLGRYVADERLYREAVSRQRMYASRLREKMVGQVLNLDDLFSAG